MICQEIAKGYSGSFETWHDGRGRHTDMTYFISAQGKVVDTIDVSDRFGKKDEGMMAGKN